MIYFLLCLIFFENFTILFFPPPAQEVLARCVLQDINNNKWCAACSHKASGASYCLLYVLSSVCVWVGGRRTASGTLLPLTQGSPLVMCDCRSVVENRRGLKRGGFHSTVADSREWSYRAEKRHTSSSVQAVPLCLTGVCVWKLSEFVKRDAKQTVLLPEAAYGRI